MGDMEMENGATSLFEPSIDDDDNMSDVSDVDDFAKNVMVSPTEHQFTTLHNRLRERLLHGETIYEIGVGGK